MHTYAEKSPVNVLCFYSGYIIFHLKEGFFKGESMKLQEFIEKLKEEGTTPEEILR